MVVAKQTILRKGAEYGTDFFVPFYVNPINPTLANDYNTNLYLNFFAPSGFKANRDGFFADEFGNVFDRLVQIKATICDDNGNITTPTPPQTEPFQSIDNGGTTPLDVTTWNYTTENHSQMLLNLWVYLNFIFGNYPNTETVQLEFTLKNSVLNNTVIVNSYPFAKTGGCKFGGNCDTREYVILESAYTGDCSGNTGVIKPFDSIGRAYNNIVDNDSTATERTRKFANRILVPGTLKQLPSTDEYETAKAEGIVSQNTITNRYQLITLLPMPSVFIRELQTIFERGTVKATIINIDTDERESYDLLRETRDYIIPDTQNVEVQDNDRFVVNCILTEKVNIVNFDCCADFVPKECIVKLAATGFNELTVGTVVFSCFVDGLLQNFHLVFGNATSEFLIPYNTEFILNQIIVQSANPALVDNPDYSFTITCNCETWQKPTPPTGIITIDNTTGTTVDVTIIEHTSSGGIDLNIIYINAGQSATVVNNFDSIYYIEPQPTNSITVTGDYLNVIQF